MPFSLQTEAVISKDLFILIWNAILKQFSEFI